MRRRTWSQLRSMFPRRGSSSSISDSSSGSEISEALRLLEGTGLGYKWSVDDKVVKGGTRTADVAAGFSELSVATGWFSKALMLVGARADLSEDILTVRL